MEIFLKIFEHFFDTNERTEKEEKGNRYLGAHNTTRVLLYIKARLKKAHNTRFVVSDDDDDDDDNSRLVVVFVPRNVFVVVVVL